MSTRMPHGLSCVIPVFRNGERALDAVSAMLGQDLPSCMPLDVLLVDDGSGDGTADLIATNLPAGARLLRLERNLGRSGARNAGAAAARGDLLLFMDCDCVPADTGFIAAHLRRLQQGAVASTGPVVGTGQGFWHAFQVGSSTRRAALYERGVPYAGSTQNLLVRRGCFKAIGGFDETYRAYGFEDRDLLIRLAVLGPIAWADDAVVEHHDDLNLATVCRKMREAGAGSSSRIFATRHADAYRALGYAAVDAKLHPARARLAKAGAPLLPLLIAAVSTALEWRWIPFSLRRLAVRALSATSYLLGTTEAEDVQGG